MLFLKRSFSPPGCDTGWLVAFNCDESFDLVQHLDTGQLKVTREFCIMSPSDSAALQNKAGELGKGDEGTLREAQSLLWTRDPGVRVRQGAGDSCGTDRGVLEKRELLLSPRTAGRKRQGERVWCIPGTVQVAWSQLQGWGLLTPSPFKHSACVSWASTTGRAPSQVLGILWGSRSTTQLTEWSGGWRENKHRRAPVRWRPASGGQLSKDRGWGRDGWGPPFPVE